MKRTIVLMLAAAGILTAQKDTAGIDAARLAESQRQSIAAEQQFRLEQQQNQFPGPKITKLVSVKNSYSAGKIIELFGKLPAVALKRSGNDFALTGPEKEVNALEVMIHQLDVPPPPPSPPQERYVTKDLQITAWLVIASPQPIQGNAIPKELEPVVAQVASALPYKSFNVLDAIVIRTRENTEGTAKGVLPVNTKLLPNGGTYMISTGRIVLNDGQAASAENRIGLSPFDVQLSVNTPSSPQTIQIHANLNAKENQKIVVGKSNVDGSENALIVVLTAKVMD